MQPDQLIEWCNFFDKLKKIINKNKEIEKILVISHGGILDLIQHILCNVDVETKIYFTSENSGNNKYLDNCSLLYLAFENDKFKLIAPANTYHLI